MVELENSHAIAGCEIQEGEEAALNAISSDPLQAGRVIRLRINGTLYCYDVLTLKKIIRVAEQGDEWGRPQPVLDPFTRQELSFAQIERIKAHPVQLEDDWGQPEPEPDYGWGQPAAVDDVTRLKEEAIRTYRQFLGYMAPVHSERWDTVVHTSSPDQIVKYFTMAYHLIVDYFDHPDSRTSAQLPVSGYQFRIEMATMLLSWRPAIMDVVCEKLNQGEQRQRLLGVDLRMSRPFPYPTVDRVLKDCQLLRQQWVLINECDSAIDIERSMEGICKRYSKLRNQFAKETQYLLATMRTPRLDGKFWVKLSSAPDKFREVFAHNPLKFYECIAQVISNNPREYSTFVAIMTELKDFYPLTDANKLYMLAHNSDISQEWVVFVEHHITEVDQMDLAQFRLLLSTRTARDDVAVLRLVIQKLESKLPHHLQLPEPTRRRIQVEVDVNEDEDNDNLLETPHRNKVSQKKKKKGSQKKRTATRR